MKTLAFGWLGLVVVGVLIGSAWDLYLAYETRGYADYHIPIFAAIMGTFVVILLTVLAFLVVWGTPQ